MILVSGEVNFGLVRIIFLEIVGKPEEWLLGLLFGQLS